jgi:hypothetical protein
MDELLENSFEQLCRPLIAALESQLGGRYLVTPVYESPQHMGVRIGPNIDRERRTDPERHTLDLKLVWPDVTWIEFSHLNETGQQRRAYGFSAHFMSRIDELEAWHEFQLSSSSQRYPDPITIEFEYLE